MKKFCEGNLGIAVWTILLTSKLLYGSIFIFEHL